MTFPVLPYPAVLDPVLLQVGGLQLRWYGLMYVVAFLLGSWIMGVLVRRYRRLVLTDDVRADFLVWAVVGVVLGGRLGYVLFYNLPAYLEAPWKVLAVWEGGMSFHGGLLGLTVAGVLFARRRGIPLLPLADLVAVPAALGLMFGRIGNFLNVELLGRPSTLPWAMLFPGELIPRHPVQLYAAGKDLLLFVVVLLVYRYARRPGVAIGVFLVGYGVLRFLVEFVREPDAQIGMLGIFTLGQLLTLPLLLAGLALLFWVERKPGTTLDKKDENAPSSRSDA